jgi:hypothetical protein
MSSPVLKVVESEEDAEGSSLPHLPLPCNPLLEPERAHSDKLGCVPLPVFCIFVLRGIPLSKSDKIPRIGTTKQFSFAS